MDDVYRVKTARKLVLYGIILFGLFEVGLIRLVFPAYYTHSLLLIPAYFLLSGICILFILKNMKRKNIHPGRAVILLMFFSLAQMLCSFFVMFFYYYFAETNKLIMLFAFCVFYIYFMGIKFFIIHNIDIQHKTKKNQLQHEEEEK